jgi:predicted ATPase/class 3 adenylate cyclase
VTSPAIAAPSGNVTFVFTDIEGSTRMFHRLGDQFVDLLHRHNHLLSNIWVRHDGYEVSTEGDSFFVAFGSADDAIEACADAQRQLDSEDWPEGGHIKVRMGIHTGLASLYEDNYVALAVHQAARVVAAAHGGQILVSQDTVDASGVFDDLELRPVGRFQLRSFDEPLELYQVAGDGLGDAFPAIRALPAGHHNIVRRPTATIGRGSFISTIAEQVEPGKLLTLLGPGGVGKTTVAAEVGVMLASKWPDGVWLVDLAGVEDHGLVASAIAAAVGASTNPARDSRDDVLEHLATKSAVIILDNCEQVLSGCARLVRSLEDRCPQVGVLATSRLPIGVPGEALWHVAPLDVPDVDVRDAPSVLASPAGRLFAERAATARPGFEIDETNAADVAEIVRGLDGIPLSLELAAARLAMQSPAEIRIGLDDRFRLLRSREAAGASRHSSMEELLEWSYRSLTENEQAAFRRLAVFATGFSLVTSRAAVADSEIDVDDVPLLLFSLVDNSLVVADLTANATRYRLLETFKEYGRRLLEDHDEAEAIAERVANAMLQRLGPWQTPGSDWLAEVDTEADNLRGLIALISTSNPEVAQELACTLARHHDATQSFRDGIEEISNYVTALLEPTPTRVSLLAGLADLHLRIGEVGAARSLIDEAAELRQHLGAPDWDDVGVDRTQGEVARRSGDLTGAVDIAQEALERASTDRGRSRMYNLLGTTSAALGDMTTAYEACTSELDLNKAVGHDAYVASAHGNLAEIAMRLGDVPEAARHQGATLSLAVAQGSTAMVAFSMIMAARIAGQREDWEAAALLHGHGEQLLEQLGLVLYEDDRRESDELVAAARTALGDEAFLQIDTAGRNMSVPEATRQATELFERAGQQPGA